MKGEQMNLNFDNPEERHVYTPSFSKLKKDNKVKIIEHLPTDPIKNEKADEALKEYNKKLYGPKKENIN